MNMRQMIEVITRRLFDRDPGPTPIGAIELGDHGNQIKLGELQGLPVQLAGILQNELWSVERFIEGTTRQGEPLSGSPTLFTSRFFRVEVAEVYPGVFRADIYTLDKPYPFETRIV